MRHAHRGNRVRAFGSGIFFVSNNHDGTLYLDSSIVRGNAGGGWNVLPRVSMHEDTTSVVSGSTLERATNFSLCASALALRVLFM